MDPASSDLNTHKSGWFGTLQSVLLDQFRGAEEKSSTCVLVVSYVSLLLGYTVLAAAEVPGKELSTTAAECSWVARPA